MTRKFPSYLLRFALAGAIVAMLSSCSVTRRVPEGKRLLIKNSVKEDKNAPRSERIRSAEVEKLIQPQPNRKLLGTNAYLQFYNAANPDTTKRGLFNRLMRRWGEAPVLLDSMLVEQSAGSIRNYATYGGFYNAEVTYSVDTSRRKKASVTYRITQNTPYRIGTITHDFRDEFLRPIVMGVSWETLLHTGDLLDGNVLRAEKARIRDLLRNNGYYNFDINNIEFLGDSTSGNHTANITVVYKQSLSGYTQQGAPIYENSSIYRINRIFVDPGYNPLRELSEQDFSGKMDTISYRGLEIIYPSGEKPKVRRRILRQAINLYPNYIYSAGDVQDTYSDIMRLGYFRNANIMFETLPDTMQHNEVTYIGGDEQTSETTTERYMDCRINCTPALRQGYKIELEGTTSSSFNAINATVGYQNRNLFRGVELFDISVKGGYEFTRVKGAKSSFEVGGAMSLSFPRFIAPFRLDPYNRRVNPRTKLELSINTQRRRPFYSRTVSGMTWGYSWSNRHKSSFSIRPIDINIVDVGFVSDEFLENRNDYFKKSFESQFVAGISGSFVYNTQLATVPRHFLFRFNWETAGNLLNLATRAFDSPYKQQTDNGNGTITTREYYRIFGMQFAQYMRTDISVSNHIALGPKTEIAWRFMAGTGFSYGNSSSVPYDRLFYAGGSTSMRGWIARTLGPGNALPSSPDTSYGPDDPIPVGQRYPNQVGNLKLEANAELRFPVWGMLNGALFFDVGNVWFLSENQEKEESIFKLDRFYRQLGFNTGLGLRIDIGMAVLRFDWGIRLHDPNYPKGKRWIKNFRLNNTVLNFGVGYPF